ncbi:MAG: MBL fold metallo-hydrolase [Lachnospiraceae bacterium]|nr:MBL fold metallo-hydrolase [Lachnospiraceae bacterium]
MRITVLTDNIEYKQFAAEWGLSILIEYDGRKYLLDTGASRLFADNAALLGIDIADVDFSTLSHAHWDHANGFDTFFALNSKAKLYLRKGTGENCYGTEDKTSEEDAEEEKRAVAVKEKLAKQAEHEDPVKESPAAGSSASDSTSEGATSAVESEADEEARALGYKYIGIRHGYLEKYRDRIEYVEGNYELAPGAKLIPHRTPGLDAIGRKAGMYLKIGSSIVPDDFRHEQSLVFETPKGLIIFNSCSHGGADNIIREVSKEYPGQKLYAMIGGFHLFELPDDEVRAFAGRVRETGIEHILTGHCTGDPAMEILREELGDMAQQMHAGLQLDL